MKKLLKALKLGALACCVSAQIVIPAYAEKEDKPVIRIAFPKAEHDSESIQISGAIPSGYNYAYAEDKQRALKAGMNDHIAKPVDFKQLLRTLAQCC